MANSASSRSARVSPMPIRMPDVKGIRALPAASIVANLAAGSCRRERRGMEMSSKLGSSA